MNGLDPNADLPMVRHEGADPSELPPVRDEERPTGLQIVVWSLAFAAIVGVWLMALSGGAQ